MKLLFPSALRISLAAMVAGALISLVGCGGGGGGGGSTAGTSIAPLPSNAVITGPASAPVGQNNTGPGTVTSPNGSVPNNTSITIAAINSRNYQSDFAMTAAPFSPSLVRSYIIQVSVGPVAPTVGIPVVLVVPPAVVANLGGAAPTVFVQMLEQGGDNVLDDFEAFPSVYSGGTPATVSLTLPVTAFTNSRDNSGNFECNIVIAGAQDTTSGAIATPAVADACLGSPIGSPLQGTAVSALQIEVHNGFNGAFNPPSNMGVDLVSTLGQPVISVANGFVVDVCYQTSETAKNKYNEHCGWGYHVVIQNSDGTKTVYAHLEKGSITVTNGEAVTKGQVIGAVGQTGGVMFPHLHLEYVVHQVKVDPFPCFQ